MKANMESAGSKIRLKEISVLTLPCLLLASLGIALNLRREKTPIPTPQKPKPASKVVIPIGSYLSVRKVTVGAISKEERPAYSGLDTKVSVTLFYSGPLPANGQPPSMSPQEKRVLIDEKGQSYRFNIVTSYGSAQNNDMLRSWTYSYYVDTKQVPLKNGKVTLKDWASGDRCKPIPISIVVRH